MKQLPVWILIRGLCREQQHWGDFPEMLTRQLRQRCASHLLAPRPVLTLDLPGNGCLHDQESPATVPAMAEHLRQQVRQALAAQGMVLGGQHPVCVLALSMGGMVALEWARRHPHEVEGLVLVNSSVRGLSAFYRRLRPRQYFRILRLLMNPLDASRVESVILDMTSQQQLMPRDRESLLAKWLSIRQRHPVTRRNVWRQLWASARYRWRGAQPVHAECLVLGCLGDELVHPSCSSRLAQALDADHEWHPWAGHDLPLDDPNWLLDHLWSGWWPQHPEIREHVALTAGVPSWSGDERKS